MTGGTLSERVFRAPDADEQESARRFLERLLWTIMGALTVGVAVGYLTGTAGWRAAGLVTLVDLAGAGLLLLNRLRRTRLASGLLIVLAWAVVVSRAVAAGGLHSPVPSALILITVAAGLLLSYRAGGLSAAVLCLTALGIAVAEWSGFLPVAPQPGARGALLLTLVATVCGICAVQFVAIRAVRQAQTRSREREDLLARVLENLPVGVWFVDRTGRLVHRNQAAERSWGGGRLVGLDGYGEYKARRPDSGEVIEPHE